MFVTHIKNEQQMIAYSGWFTRRIQKRPQPYGFVSIATGDPWPLELHYNEIGYKQNPAGCEEMFNELKKELKDVAKIPQSHS